MKPDNLENPFSPLVDSGVLTSGSLDEAAQIAARHHLRLSDVLQKEYGLSRSVLHQALSAYYQCPVIEYDERLPVPPEPLTKLPAERLAAGGWFPVIREDDGSVVIAAINPDDPSLPAEVEKYLGPGLYKFYVSLPEDIAWYIQDFLHAKPGELIGTERTGLAYWRNNMAQWRTILACYRTDMAKARTALAIVRAGLALITISFALSRAHMLNVPLGLSILILVVGCILGIGGIPAYLDVRRAHLKPPENQTLMEVTAATLVFLENYHFLSGTVETKPPTRHNMLARLSDFLSEFCTIFYPSPASRERTHLARERNVLAAQRTIAACNRTIYARARTGLAFTRTGFSFMSIGIGLIKYFGFGTTTIFDGTLILIGLMLATDGIHWYMPAHRQQAEFSELGTRFTL